MDLGQFLIERGGLTTFSYSTKTIIISNYFFIENKTKKNKGITYL